LKKGISPLIATVLLVGLTIAIAAFVITFLVEKTTDNFKPDIIIGSNEYCDLVTLGHNVDPASLCEKSGGYVFGVALTNKGSFTIHKVTISAEGFPNSEGNITLKPQEQIPIFTPYNADPTIKHLVKVVPWIQDPNTKDTIICTDSPLVFDMQNIIDAYTVPGVPLAPC
jgi:flagellin-like protein